jgi:uncharacterized membrane-anchored protein
MSMFPPDHALRITLADEVHARPPEPVRAPARASYVAVLVPTENRAHELAHLTALCKSQGVAPPEATATHFLAHFGSTRLKWERHGEFSGYTVITETASDRPFAHVAASLLPAGWLAGIPGTTIAAVHAEVLATDSVLDPSAPMQLSADMLADIFNNNFVIGSGIAEGAGIVYSDFQLHDGCSRFVLVNHSLTERQAGRTLQRLFEIEAYRMLALLALPIARKQSPRTVEIENALAHLTGGIAKDNTGDDEKLLHELTRLAAEIESGLATSQFRFGACRAYFELVTRRIVELRETRLPGMQTIDEFMARRFTPAVQTCSTVSQRLHDLSERVAQASSLLSTRVNIARERQNQSLLSSMDRRAKLQLRLQQTVEGLSVAAICYYVAGLVGYLSKGLKVAGLRVEPDVAVAVTIPIVAVGVMVAVRRARKRIAGSEGARHAL